MLASLASLDDATGAGKFASLEHWWDIVISGGGIYGCCLSESGSWIILKIIKS